MKARQNLKRRIKSINKELANTMSVVEPDMTLVKTLHNQKDRLEERLCQLPFFLNPDKHQTEHHHHEEEHEHGPHCNH